MTPLKDHLAKAHNHMKHKLIVVGWMVSFSGEDWEGSLSPESARTATRGCHGSAHVEGRSSHPLVIDQVQQAASSSATWEDRLLGDSRRLGFGAGMSHSALMVTWTG
ncbi:hypothetical protein PAHAL_6G113000 [Panicum hallii]|uniref:Uncharacterized protein n=1 Tax=Panicum hallii TaxID=206008 RepID=A0A2S3I1K3_9POAL|nr:hypothetical protein PAHAL_6G113000 [Panicum hallii]PAN34557.1 hypothetical protein PAHAL_6G113000 [Panicum hallii]